MSHKKCFFGCVGKLHFFKFPKETTARAQWMDFVFGNQIQSSCNVLVCDRHFTNDCWLNKGQYDGGFANKLLLKPGAVPSIKEDQDSDTEPHVLIEDLLEGNSCVSKRNSSTTSTQVADDTVCMQDTSNQAVHAVVQTDPVRVMAVDEAAVTAPQSMRVMLQQPADATVTALNQTYSRRGDVLPVYFIFGDKTQRISDSASSALNKAKVSASTQTLVSTKAVATQLSYSTLRPHLRSKATQTVPSGPSASESAPLTAEFQLLYMPASGSMPSEDPRPAKKPRLEAPTDHEEDSSDMELRVDLIDESGHYSMQSGKILSVQGGRSFTVLENNLLDLFKTCPACHRDCKVQRQRLETCLSFSQFCRNCGYSRMWQSQGPEGSADVGALLRAAEGVASFTLVEEEQDNQEDMDRLPGLYRRSEIQAARLETSNPPEKPTPQHIVSEEAILQLTRSCPICKKSCRCTKRVRGPYLVIYQSCYFCHYQRKWTNQPEAQMLSICKTKTSKKKCHALTTF